MSREIVYLGPFRAVVFGNKTNQWLEFWDNGVQQEYLWGLIDGAVCLNDMVLDMSGDIIFYMEGNWSYSGCQVFKSESSFNCFIARLRSALKDVESEEDLKDLKERRLLNMKKCT